MALTIVKRPYAVSPVHNPMIFKVLDGSYTLPSYKYSWQVWVGTLGTTPTTLVSTHDIYPDASGYGTFDVSNILRDYIPANKFSYNNFLDIDCGGVLFYTVTLNRKYLTSGVETTEFLYRFTGSDNYSPLKAFDAAVQNDELLNWTGSTGLYYTRLYPGNNGYVVGDNFNGYLSNIPVWTDEIPNRIILNLYDYYTVDLFNFPQDSVNISKYIRTIYVSCGGSTYIKYKSNTNQNQNSITRIGIGPKNIDALSTAADWDYVTPGAKFPPISGNDDTEYNVFFLDNNSTLVGKNIKFTVCRETNNIYTTNKDNPRMWLVYKNRFCGYSWLPFHEKSYKIITTERNYYNKRIQYNSTVYSRGNTILNSNIKDTFILNTMPLEKYYMPYFEDLFTSNDVYLIQPVDENGVENIYPVTPVNILDGDYTLKTWKNDKLVQYTITAEASEKHNIQR